MSMSLKSLIKVYLKWISYHLPIQKDKIVFINYDFKGYGDNPKYIAEEIVRQGLPYKLVWLVNGDCFVPSYIKKVYLFRGVTWFYELSTAGVIVINFKGILIPYLYKKRKTQFLLQTWHGDFPLKYIEKEVENTLGAGYLEGSKADSAVTNAIVSGNKQFTEILRKSFWLPQECAILEYGVPRNDIYFKDRSFRDRLKTKFGFSLEDSILLYAPTFRDDHDFSCYDIDFERLKRFLCKVTDKRWKIIIRLHPNVSSMADMFCYGDDIINGTVCSDQQELCMISDCLVTDYSSIMADFMLMKKPVFLYATDLDKYSNHNTNRGLREVFYKLPFPLNRTQDELESCIVAFDKKEYGEQLNAFIQEYYCSFDNGHASECVVNYLKKVF